jgi:hypothetical protein
MGKAIEDVNKAAAIVNERKEQRAEGEDRRRAEGEDRRQKGGNSVNYNLKLRHT